jgi:hypothetical protein
MTKEAKRQTGRNGIAQAGPEMQGLGPPRAPSHNGPTQNKRTQTRLGRSGDFYKRQALRGGLAQVPDPYWCDIRTRINAKVNFLCDLCDMGQVPDPWGQYTAGTASKKQSVRM